MSLRTGVDEGKSGGGINEEGNSKKGIWMLFWIPYPWQRILKEVGV